MAIRRIMICLKMVWTKQNSPTIAFSFDVAGKPSLFVFSFLQQGERGLFQGLQVHTIAYLYMQIWCN